jgi:hypothetical protein
MKPINRVKSIVKDFVHTMLKTIQNGRLKPRFDYTKFELRTLDEYLKK